MREPVSWCGSRGLVFKAVDRGAGIRHVDLLTRKLTMVIKNPLVQSGAFCSHDGLTVFFNRFRPSRPGEEDEPGHGEQPHGLWAYEMKSGRMRKIGDTMADSSFRRPAPASPSAKTYLLVDGRGRPPALPGWTFTSLPTAEPEEDLIAQWARDGSYVAVLARARRRVAGREPIRWRFHSATGELIREVPASELDHSDFDRVRAHSQGLYMAGHGRLKLFRPWSGALEDLPQPVDVHGRFTFDVAADGTVAYASDGGKGNRWNTGLRVVTSSGQVEQVSPDGTHPVLSETGDYLAAIEWRPDRGDAKLVVYRRARPVRGQGITENRPIRAGR